MGYMVGGLSFACILGIVRPVEIMNSPHHDYLRGF